MDPEFIHINHQPSTPVSFSCAQRKKFPSRHNTGVLNELMVLFFYSFQNKSHGFHLVSLLSVKLIATVFFIVGIFYVIHGIPETFFWLQLIHTVCWSYYDLIDPLS
jgi:hypothetical protein